DRKAGAGVLRPAKPGKIGARTRREQRQLHRAGHRSTLPGDFPARADYRVFLWRREFVGAWYNCFSMPTLDWIGKEAVVSHADEVPTRLLHCDKKLSVGAQDSANLLVEGDNL